MLRRSVRDAELRDRRAQRVYGPARSCQECGGPLIQRANEKPGRFAARRFCSNRCAARVGSRVAAARPSTSGFIERNGYLMKWVPGREQPRGTSTGKDRLTMMGQLYDHLVEQLEKGQIVCLMIDEAQNLSVEMLEELRLLSNLETDTEKLIQIVLVGQPEFEEKLDWPELVQLKQRVALRCRLQPLQAHEIGLYIDSRLQTVHYMRPDLFDAESIERIALHSKGIPRLINAICDNALLIAYTNNRGYITAAWTLQGAVRSLRLGRKGFLCSWLLP